MLYDLHVSLHETRPSSANLPWQISIRLRDFPAELVQASAIKTCFLQSLKEADQLKHKGNVIYGMTADEHQRLFDSVVNGNWVVGFIRKKWNKSCPKFRSLRRLLVGK